MAGAFWLYRDIKRLPLIESGTAASTTSAGPDLHAMQAEVQRLRAENKTLREAMVEMSQSQTKLMQGRATESPKGRLGVLYIDLATGHFSSDAALKLGLSSAELHEGNLKLEETIASLRELEIQHLEAPVATGNVIVIKANRYEAETDKIVEEFYSQLAEAWNPSAVESLRGLDRARLFAGTGAGYADRTILVTASSKRPGYFEVAEDYELANGRGRRMSVLSVDELAKRFGLSSVPPRN